LYVCVCVCVGLKDADCMFRVSCAACRITLYIHNACWQHF